MNFKITKRSELIPGMLVKMTPKDPKCETWSGVIQGFAGRYNVDVDIVDVVGIFDFRDWTWEQDPDRALRFAAYHNGVVWGLGNTEAEALADAERCVNGVMECFRVPMADMKVALCSHAVFAAVEFYDYGAMGTFKVVQDRESGKDVLVMKKNYTVMTKAMAR